MSMSVQCYRKGYQIILWNCAICGGPEFSHFDLPSVAELHLGCMSMPVYEKWCHTVTCSEHYLQSRSFHKCFHIQILIIYFLMHINLRFILSLPSMEDSSSLFLWCPRLLSIYLTIRMYNAIFKSGCSILRMLNFQRSKEDATVVGILQIHQNIAWSKQILIKKKKKSGLISNFNAHLDNSFRIMW